MHRDYEHQETLAEEVESYHEGHQEGGEYPVEEHFPAHEDQGYENGQHLTETEQQYDESGVLDYLRFFTEVRIRI